MLTVAKVLNNNIAVVIDAAGNDCIAMGRGIAFQRKHGDQIDERDVERLFTQRVPELTKRLNELAASIPEEYFEAAQAIVEHAKLRLRHDLDDVIYLALADHIHFAIQRVQAGQVVDNRLTFEIKMVYRDEFECAQTAVAYLNRIFEVSLPESEAGFIALHFVNASTGVGMDGTVEMATIIQRALDIVRERFDLVFDESSTAYYRFMVHLKFFAQRVMMAQATEDDTGPVDLRLRATVRRGYPQSFACAEEICGYVRNTFGYSVPQNELVYLALHIERVQAASLPHGREGA
ncbi:MAG TPA: PRD domain-containing protein [Candidatus Coprousia avicola]|nr:PRD domain-containing protein [Candidatus Coprousia avicola]